jgi:rRNA maturation endonuclease Nob1
MSTLTQLATATRAVWVRCAGCDRLFPAEPDQTRCPDCATEGGDSR